jgi:hypothetical protein
MFGKLDYKYSRAFNDILSTGLDDRSSVTSYTERTS